MLENCGKTMHWRFNFDACPMNAQFGFVHLTHQNFTARGLFVTIHSQKYIRRENIAVVTVHWSSFLAVDIIPYRIPEHNICCRSCVLIFSPTLTCYPLFYSIVYISWFDQKSSTELIWCPCEGRRQFFVCFWASLAPQPGIITYTQFDCRSPSCSKKRRQNFLHTMDHKLNSQNLRPSLKTEYHRSDTKKLSFG